MGTFATNNRSKNSGFFYKLFTSKIFWIFILFLGFVWLNNTSLLVNWSEEKPALLAHGALGQTYDLQGVKWNTNTAAIIHKPEHFYIENTIPSIQVSFDYGADIVEFDIRMTADKQLAVFHDYTLEYRTDGKGNVADHTMDELRTLDVGYGYTADHGQSYPLRGLGKGLMVTIEDVFLAFPDKQFLVNIKDGGEEIGQVLLNFLRTLDASQVRNISVYGNEAALSILKAHYPKMQVLSVARLKKALLSYMLIGWTGIIPEKIQNMELHLPVEYAKFLWGWPDKFLQRMDKVNTRVVIVKYVNGWSDGFNSESDLKLLPKNYTGTIWTDRIDIIGPLLREAGLPERHSSTPTGADQSDFPTCHPEIVEG